MRRDSVRRTAPSAADIVLRGTTPDAITDAIRDEGRRRNDAASEQHRVKALREELVQRLNQARGFASAEAFARALLRVLEPLRSLLGGYPEITGIDPVDAVGRELIALATDPSPEIVARIATKARQRALEGVCAYSEIFDLSFPHAPRFNDAWSGRFAKKARDFVDKVFADPETARKDLGPPVLQYFRCGLWTALAALVGLTEQGGIFKDPDAPTRPARAGGRRAKGSIKRANGPNRGAARRFLIRLCQDPNGAPIESTALLKALGKERHRSFLSRHENIDGGRRDDRLVVVDHGGPTVARKYWRPSVIRALAEKWVDNVPSAVTAVINVLPTAAQFLAARHPTPAFARQRSQNEHQRSQAERS